MKTIGLTLGMLLLSALFASASNAQVQRTFVSGFGSDSDPCSHAAPCRTFAQAISQTNPGGEVVALDSAGYGPFTINKSVTVEAAPGVYAGVTAFSGDAVTIAAPSVPTRVILRGLTLEGLGAGNDGIHFNPGSLVSIIVQVDGCVINGFVNHGITFSPTSSGASALSVKNSTIINNGDAGILVSGAGTNGAIVSVDRVRLEANDGPGLVVFAGATASISNSVASSNSLSVSSITTGVVAELNIEACVVTGNVADGIQVDAQAGGIATCRVSNSAITRGFAQM